MFTKLFAAAAILVVTSQAMAESSLDRMSLTGKATVQAEPDTAYISAAVVTKHDNAQMALTLNSKAMNEVYAVLKAKGVERKEITTSNFSFNKTYRQVQLNAGGYKNVFDGYQVSNNIRVEVCDLESLGTIITTLVDAGVTDMGQVSFGSTQAEAKLNEARVAATKAAIAKGKLFAEAAGFKLARITALSEYQSTARPEYSKMLFRSVAGDRPPISGGSLSFSVTVSITWRIID